MKLSQLLSIYPQLKWGDFATAEVTGLCRDSRKVENGSVYVAISGYSHDGHNFIEQAVAQGAIALIVETENRVPPSYKGAIVKVENTRQALNKLASRLYEYPAEKLFCVGVTGTNGKTTVTYMVEKILTDYGWPTGVLGTIDHHMGANTWKSELTTPDAIDLQRRLSEFVALDAKAAAFEVSSHALSQFRADYIPFDVAVFTNLSRDHLDFHPSMQSYFAAKERLFKEILAQSEKREVFAIINTDDEWGKKLIITDRAKRYTYGERNADFTFRVIQQNFTGSQFHLETPRGSVDVTLPVPGLFNIYNAVASVSVALCAGVSVESAAQSLSDFTGVKGRLQRVSPAESSNVFVDYAHTPDALEKVLTALNEIRKNLGKKIQIICVFGCGGDRDPGKRPIMGEIAHRLSDIVFVTSDNPRKEPPRQIIKDILAGIPSEALNQSVFEETDRREAISRALQMASENDVILVAGKGHEDYQLVGDQILPFSDAETVRELLG